jgi:hypothetical protein
MNNAKKYGQPSNDVISQMFAISYAHGVGFCKGNILKYITRYNKVKEMPLFSRLWHKLNGKGNQSDLVKADDYYRRLIKTGGLSKYFELEEWYLNVTK